MKSVAELISECFKCNEESQQDLCFLIYLDLSIYCTVWAVAFCWICVYIYIIYRDIKGYKWYKSDSHSGTIWIGLSYG